MNKFLLFISTLLFTSFVYGQGDEIYEHGLDEGKWQDIRDGIRYEGQKKGPGREWTYESKEEYNNELRRYGSGEGGGVGDGEGNGFGSGEGVSDRPRTKYKPPPRMPKSNLRLPNFSGLGFLGYIFIGIFVIALMILIYYLFVNAERKGKKIKSTPIDFEDVNPTEIPLTELERLLREAIANKDYRGAIRIYFIFIVRDLAEKKWIKWEKEKTNFHYLREMTGKKEYDDFNQSISYFEIIWYGKREIDIEKFEIIKPKFTRFLDKLGVK